MEFVLRTVLVFAFVQLVLRLSGKRTMGEITTFDFILLLIISESVQEALLDQDSSLTAGVIVILTFIVLDIVLSLLKQKFQGLEKVMDGVPTMLMKDGRLQRRCMTLERVDETDILEAARKKFGIERLDQIKDAVLEKSGGISIVPAHSPFRS